MKPSYPLYGLLAEFAGAEEILAAARRARQAGYRRMDAYSPYSVEGLAAELGQQQTRIPSIVLIAGLVGAGAGFLMQYYTMGIDYPLNVGGRPYNSWPVFMPITFEVMVLVASLGAFFGMLFLNGLPQPHHPLFSVPRFARASQDGYFLCIEASDPRFDLHETSAFLASLHPLGEVYQVPRQPPAVETEAEEAVGQPLSPDPGSSESP